MKELLQGRRLGYAPRPQLGQIGLGLGIATTLLDFMAWFQWGARDTNGFVIAAYWLAIATAAVLALAALTSFAELLEAPDEERSLSRLDFAASVAVTLLYVASAALRSGELGAAGASPAALLLALAAVVVMLVDGVIAANLYAAREWEVVDEAFEPERRRRRRTAAR